MKKKIALVCALLLSAASLPAQKMAETVYLKNGSIIRGTIVEQVPGKTIKIQTKDGSVFVYRMDEVSRIAKEQPATTASTDKYGHGHKGLDFTLEGGVALGKGGSASGMGGVEIGKRFSQNFYWGVGVGVLGGGNADLRVPVTTTFQALFPVTASGIAPNIALRTGFIANTADDQTVGSGKYQSTIEAKHGWEISLLPGVQIPLNQKIDFNINLGYQCGITFGGGAGHGFLLKAGFGFHKPYECRKPKEKVPTRDRGLQYGIEAAGCFGKTSGGGPALMLSYKWNPNISVGLGYQVGSFAADRKITEGELHHEDEIYGVAHSVFLRGQYRLTDKKFSPFASADIGFRKYKFDDSGFYLNHFNYKKDPSLKSGGFLFTPAVGVSLRTTNNSYLEFKIGYKCINGTKAVKDHRENYRGDSEYLIIKKTSLSHLILGIGYTHTLKCGSGLKDKMTDRYNKVRTKLSKKK